LTASFDSKLTLIRLLEQFVGSFDSVSLSELKTGRVWTRNTLRGVLARRVIAAQRTVICCTNAVES